MDKHGMNDEELIADDLTWREQDILLLLSERLTNREIADRLHLAESTVKDYVGRILDKLYVKNRREAVTRAESLGLFDRERPSEPVSRSSLPPERTPFVGRIEELAEIKRQLGKTRLLSLVGPGGIGKSRLALKAAQEITDGFKDGIFFVPLAPIRSIRDISQTIAEVLRFPIATHEDPQIQLLRYLKNREILLIMDNFEHLMEAVGIVSEILQVAPDIKILATSRNRLNLQWEIFLPISGMAVPEENFSDDSLACDSIAMFMQSAQKVQSDFDPSHAELEQVAVICQRVGGMPLAIELAAAWLHVLNVDEIVNELEKDLDILAGEVRDAPARHRSIRDVFDQSWDMLEKVAQETFMRLSVFRGGFTRDAALQVAGVSLQLLASLSEKSFLGRDPNSGRFEIHELLRQYAQEQCEKKPDLILDAQEAHAAFYAEFMQQGWDHLRSQRQIKALAELEADIENVRGAWRFYIEQGTVPQLWKFIYTFWYLYWIRWWNHAGMELFADAVVALEEVEGDDALALKALSMAFQGYFMAFLSLPEEGYQITVNAIQILEDLDRPMELVYAYDSLDICSYFLGRISEETQATERLMKIVAEVDDKWLFAFVTFAAAMVSLINGDLPEAKKLAEINLELYKEVGDRIGSSMPLIILGHEALAREKYQEAKGFYLRCLEIAEPVNFYYSIQTATKYLSKVSLALKENEKAEMYLLRSLGITKEIGFVRDSLNLLYEYARLRTIQDRQEEAVELLTLVIQHPISDQTRWLEGRIRDSARNLLAEIETGLPADTFAQAVDRGRTADLDTIVAYLIKP
ncbi:LuxR C-terminal-related transcriptional regulator [Chloroflexota bacterium]